MVQNRQTDNELREEESALIDLFRDALAPILLAIYTAVLGSGVELSELTTEEEFRRAVEDSLPEYVPSLDIVIDNYIQFAYSMGIGFALREMGAPDNGYLTDEEIRLRLAFYAEQNATQGGDPVPDEDRTSILDVAISEITLKLKEWYELLDEDGEPLSNLEIGALLLVYATERALVRSEAIAVTETDRFENRGILETFKRNRVRIVEFMIRPWLTTGGTCPICLPFAGEQYVLGIGSDVEDQDRPELPLHPYCVCIYIIVVDEAYVLPPIVWNG